MNKSQLVEALSNHFEGNKKAAQHALESVLETVTREVARGEKVAITGFGAFEKVIRPARMVRNPRTGERTRAKKTAVPKFRPGADLKAVVSGAKKLPKPAKAAPAKKATATRTTAAPAKKTTPAKTTATKAAPAKKTTPAKSTATKAAPAKKTTAAKTTATKAAPAKKTTAAKKTAAKRS